jgi:isoamylase
VYLNGQGIADRDGRGQRIVDDSFLLCFSAYHEPLDFRVPREEYGLGWEIVVDTLHDPTGGAGAQSEGTVIAPDDLVTIGPRALVVLRAVG